VRAKEFITESTNLVLGPQLYVPRPKSLEEAAIKPDAKVWTSSAIKTKNGYTSNWVKWCANNMPRFLSEKGTLYQVSPGAKILVIKNDADAKRIAKKYNGKDANIFRDFPWDKIAQDYDAVHHDPRGMNRFKNMFMSTWDVESTAWFNTNYLTDPILVPVDQGYDEGLTRESYELDEMALPADWDPAALGHDKTFKSRLEYALQRAPRLGGGSSRVAFVIPDNGRDTVLKIAKNSKGVAQNEAEVDILTDGYVGKLDIVIPIVDYDKLNPQPTWLQTELAQKASQAALCKIMKCGRGLWTLTGYANMILGDDLGARSAKEHLKTLSPEDAEIFKEYAHDLANLVSNTSLKMGDFDRAANWGLYNGRPVVIDLGFTTEVVPLYARKR
jgi:hypothetical protein